MALPAALMFMLLAFTALGLTAWQCPLKSTLGVVCPGCGLTRAMVLLIKGHWQAAVNLHAFAPIVLGAGILLAAAGTMPARFRNRIARKLAVIERRTGFVALIILSALVYWLLRIMIHI